MTDDELLRVLEQKTPEELTLQELDYLKQRLADSAPLREALLGRLQMEGYLTAALGRIQLSPQSIVARAERQQASRRTTGLAIALAVICLPLLALAVVVLVRAVGRDNEEVVATVVGQDQPTVDDVPATVAVDATPPTEQAAPSDPAAVTEAPAVAPPSADPAPPPPVKQALPWEEVLARQGEQPDFQAVAFDPFAFDKRLPRQAELAVWFEGAAGQNFRLHEMDTRFGRCGAIEGVGKLKAPWTDDSVLRIALEHYNRLQIHFFAGEQGVTLVYYEDKGNRWAAYASTRQPGAAKPETLALTATDDDRARRTELRQGGPLELRWRNGEILFSRGDIVLLSAPLAAMPSDVFFEGRAAFQGIALERTKTDPTALPARPATFVSDKPAELDWKLRDNPQRKPEQPQPTLEKLSSGGIRLAGANLPLQADAFLPLPRVGMQEVVLQLENVTPGTSVWLGNEKGQLRDVFRFLLNRRDKRLIGRTQWPNEEAEVEVEPYTDKMLPCVLPQCWVRFVYGCGTLRTSLSVDGVHWAQTEHGGDSAEPNYASIGVQVVANRPQAEITIKRIELRELTALQSLAGADLRERASPFPLAPTMGAWLAEVVKLQPADVTAGDWRRASALRTLAAGCRAELANHLLEALLDDPFVAQLPFEKQLAVHSDAMLLCWDLRDNGAMRIGLPTRIRNLGMQAYDTSGVGPWSSVHKLAMSAPVDTWLQTPPDPAPAIRWELIDAIENKSPEQTLELCRELRLFQQQPYAPLLAWAESTAQRDASQRPRGGTIAAMKDAWRHPLREDLSKDAYNLLSEMQAILDSEAWADAAHSITALEPEAATGLAPYHRDRQLLVSIPVAVRLMLADYPQLRMSLGERFAALGKLRLNRAMSSGEWSEVELASVQFAGTDEAAAAHRWMGDRALSSGWFDRAIVEYQRAEALQPSLGEQAAPRVRLAAALQGRDEGQPIKQAVHFGGTDVPPETFEALIKEMRSRGQTDVVASSHAVDGSRTVLSAKPTGLQAKVGPRLDGLVGEQPNEQVIRKTNQFKVPWADRQIATVVEDDMLYVSNRFQVAAYDLAKSQRLWRSTPPGQPAAKSQEFALIPMRPLVTPTRIYARMLYTANPLLVCLHKETGITIWASKTGEKEFLCSDPLIVRGKLGALSIQLQEGQEGLLRWNIFDPSTGELQSQRDLLRLRNTWGQWACCEVTQFEDSLIAVLGGATVSFDVEGGVRWVRREPVTPAEEDPQSIMQNYQRPLVAHGRMYVAQPGVHAVECVDALSGGKAWRQTLPDLVGIVGLSQGSLVVQTERDFRAMNGETGEVLWRLPVANVHPWQLLSDTSLLYAEREKISDSLWQTRFIWIDPKTGAEQGSSAVAALADADPKLGPIIAYKDRFWTFFGKGQHDPNRDLVELASSGPGDRPARVDRAALAWRDAPEAVVVTAARMFSPWRLLSGGSGDRTGLLADAHGEANVLGLRCEGGRPTVWNRPLNVPAGVNGRLKMRLATDPGMQCKLVVRMNEKVLRELEIKDETHPDRWKNLEIDVSELAGQQGWLSITVEHSGGNPAPIYWKSLELSL